MSFLDANMILESAAMIFCWYECYGEGDKKTVYL